MFTYNQLDQIPSRAKKSVVAIGNFDGIHQGHCCVLEMTKKLAQQKNCSSAVLTFHPHPRVFFGLEKKNFLITSYEERLNLIAGLGLDYAYHLPFNESFSSLSAQEFIENILFQALDVSHLVVGWNFCFGQNRQGDVDYLCQMAKERGVGITPVEPVYHQQQDHIISSSVIRDCIAKGQMLRAHDFLGRPWEIFSCVVKGDQRARSMGFPTANLLIDHLISPCLGVYAIECKISDPQHCLASKGWIKGIANVGHRPTFKQDQQLVLEVHLFDVPENTDLYDQSMAVRLCHFIRPEKKFDGLESLKSQIQEDIGQARSFFDGFSWPTL